MNQLKKDFLYCKKITKRHSKSFYIAFNCLPSEKKRAVWVIYTFCRNLDDSVDIKNNGADFEKITDEWKAFRLGNIPDKPQWRALRYVFDRFKAAREPYDDMIKGQKRDLDFKQPEDDEALLDYCSLVAGTVGRMLLPVVAVNNKEELEGAAEHLGQAMQLTNILRDVGEDLTLGRIYLSKKTMNMYGVSEEMLNRREVKKEFIELWEHYADMAEKLYQKAIKSISYYDADSQKAVLNSLKLYKAIIDKIRQGGYMCLTKRFSLNLFDKLNILLKVG
ncbi:MAG: phytoene/squalene synthase family protein [Eubacteriales bacterium]